MGNANACCSTDDHHHDDAGRRQKRGLVVCDGNSSPLGAMPRPTGFGYGSHTNNNNNNNNNSGAAACNGPPPALPPLHCSPAMALHGRHNSGRVAPSPIHPHLQHVPARRDHQYRHTSSCAEGPLMVGLGSADEDGITRGGRDRAVVRLGLAMGSSHHTSQYDDGQYDDDGGEESSTPSASVMSKSGSLHRRGRMGIGRSTNSPRSTAGGGAPSSPRKGPRQERGDTQASTAIASSNHCDVDGAVRPRRDVGSADDLGAFGSVDVTNAMLPLPAYPFPAGGDDGGIPPPPAEDSELGRAPTGIGSGDGIGRCTNTPNADATPLIARPPLITLTKYIEPDEGSAAGGGEGATALARAPNSLSLAAGGGEQRHSLGNTDCTNSNTTDTARTRCNLMRGDRQQEEGRDPSHHINTIIDNNSNSNNGAMCLLTNSHNNLLRAHTPDASSNTNNGHTDDDEHDTRRRRRKYSASTVSSAAASSANNTNHHHNSNHHRGSVGSAMRLQVITEHNLTAATKALLVQQSSPTGARGVFSSASPANLGGTFIGLQKQGQPEAALVALGHSVSDGGDPALMANADDDNDGSPPASGGADRGMDAPIGAAVGCLASASPTRSRSPFPPPSLSHAHHQQKPPPPPPAASSYFPFIGCAATIVQSVSYGTMTATSSVNEMEEEGYAAAAAAAAAAVPPHRPHRFCSVSPPPQFSPPTRMIATTKKTKSTAGAMPDASLLLFSEGPAATVEEEEDEEEEASPPPTAGAGAGGGGRRGPSLFSSSGGDGDGDGDASTLSVLVVDQLAAPPLIGAAQTLPAVAPLPLPLSAALRGVSANTSILSPLRCVKWSPCSASSGSVSGGEGREGGGGGNSDVDVSDGDPQIEGGGGGARHGRRSVVASSYFYGEGFKRADGQSIYEGGDSGGASLMASSLSHQRSAVNSEGGSAFGGGGGDGGGYVDVDDEGRLDAPPRDDAAPSNDGSSDASSPTNNHDAADGAVVAVPHQRQRRQRPSPLSDSVDGLLAIAPPHHLPPSSQDSTQEDSSHHEHHSGAIGIVRVVAVISVPELSAMDGGGGEGEGEGMGAVGLNGPPLLFPPLPALPTYTLCAAAVPRQRQRLCLPNAAHATDIPSEYTAGTTTAHSYYNNNTATDDDGDVTTTTAMTLHNGSSTTTMSAISSASNNEGGCGPSMLLMTMGGGGGGTFHPSCHGPTSIAPPSAAARSAAGVGALPFSRGRRAAEPSTSYYYDQQHHYQHSSSSTTAPTPTRVVMRSANNTCSTTDGEGEGGGGAAPRSPLCADHLCSSIGVPHHTPPPPQLLHGVQHSGGGLCVGDHPTVAGLAMRKGAPPSSSPSYPPPYCGGCEGGDGRSQRLEAPNDAPTSTVVAMPMGFAGLSGASSSSTDSSGWGGAGPSRRRRRSSALQGTADSHRDDATGGGGGGGGTDERRGELSGFTDDGLGGRGGALGLGSSSIGLIPSPSGVVTCLIGSGSGGAGSSGSGGGPVVHLCAALTSTTVLGAGGESRSGAFPAMLSTGGASQPSLHCYYPQQHTNSPNSNADNGDGHHNRQQHHSMPSGHVLSGMLSSSAMATSNGDGSGGAAPSHRPSPRPYPPSHPSVYCGDSMLVLHDASSYDRRAATSQTGGSPPPPCC